MVQQTPAPIARKRDEMGIQFVINDASFVPHGPRISGQIKELKRASYHVHSSHSLLSLRDTGCKQPPPPQESTDSTGATRGRGT
jgi:hypothetical protein